MTSLAAATGTSVADVRAANCLADIDLIYVGQSLWLPFSPGTVPPSPVIGVIGCGSNARIDSPVLGATLGSAFDVFGTAQMPDLAYYRLEVRAERDGDYRMVVQLSQPVIDGFLGRIDRAGFGTGLHYLRLVVYDSHGQSAQPCVLPVIFR